jgi:hypothetical protein
MVLHRKAVEESAHGLAARHQPRSWRAFPRPGRVHVRHALRYGPKNEDVIRLEQGNVARFQQLLHVPLRQFREHRVVADFFDSGRIENSATSLLDEPADGVLNDCAARLAPWPQLDLYGYGRRHALSTPSTFTQIVPEKPLLRTISLDAFSDALRSPSDIAMPLAPAWHGMPSLSPFLAPNAFIRNRGNERRSSAHSGAPRSSC